MDVRCERCRATYVFDDDQVTSSGLAVQCTNCGHLFKVKKKELVVTVPVRPEELHAPPVPANAVGRVDRTPDPYRVPLPAPDPFAPPEPDPFAPARMPTADPLLPALPLTPRGAAAGHAGPTVDVDLAEDDDAPPPEPSAPKAPLRWRAPLAALVVAAAAAVYAVWPEPPHPAAAIVNAPPRAATAPAAAIEATMPAPVAAPEPLGAPAAPPSAAPAPTPEPVAEAAPQSAPVPLAAPEPPKPLGPKAMLAEAERLRERGHSARALDLYGRLVSADPTNAAALAGRGLCYLELERYAPAEASFQAALEQDPENGDALLGLAETYRWQGRRADAIKYYRSYLAAHPGGEDAAAARNAVTELEE